MELSTTCKPKNKILNCYNTFLDHIYVAQGPFLRFALNPEEIDKNSKCKHAFVQNDISHLFVLFQNVKTVVSYFFQKLDLIKHHTNEKNCLSY